MQHHGFMLLLHRLALGRPGLLLGPPHLSWASLHPVGLPLAPRELVALGASLLL